jgi:hypothetical protein
MIAHLPRIGSFSPPKPDKQGLPRRGSARDAMMITNSLSGFGFLNSLEPIQHFDRNSACERNECSSSTSSRRGPVAGGGIS